MQKFINIDRFTVKKSDVRRIEKSHNGKALYVTVTGMKESICLPFKSEKEAKEAKSDLLTELGA